MKNDFKPYGLDLSYRPTIWQAKNIEKIFTAEFMRMYEAGESLNICFACAACEVWKAGRGFQHDVETGTIPNHAPCANGMARIVVRG